MGLLNPMSFTATYLFEEIGNKLMQVALLAIPILGGLITYQILNPKIIPFNLLNFLIFIISSIFAYLLNFYFNVCFSFTAFVFQNLWGSNLMKNSIVNFMSGTLIPLAFFPKAVGNIFQFFQFASLLYTPVMIYLGRYTLGLTMRLVAIQLFWLAFFYVASKLIWSIVIKHLNIQGG